LTHPEFAQELKNAKEKGVVPLAFDCAVTPDSIEIRKPILIKT
jgi:sugar fermentation stimulation protein A